MAVLNVGRCQIIIVADIAVSSLGNVHRYPWRTE